MQPRPMAETSGPRAPNLRRFMDVLLIGAVRNCSPSPHETNIRAPVRKKTRGNWMPGLGNLDDAYALRARGRLASPPSSRATATKARSAGDSCERLGKYRNSPGTL